MWPNPYEIADLVTVTFAEEILDGKLHFLCSVDELVFSTEAQDIDVKKAALFLRVLKHSYARWWIF